jgi:LPXTG-motif cell wall-anchored protein
VRARLASAVVAAALASVVPAASAATPVGAAQSTYGKQQAAPVAQPRQDDAEQRGHVIPDEDSSPERDDSTPTPPPTPPSTPLASASPVRAVAPAPVSTAAPARPELPRTGADDGALLAFLGLMLLASGVSLRRVLT